MESGGDESFWLESKYCECTQVVIFCRKSMLELDRACISEGSEGIWCSGQLGYRAKR